jgi:hypothetical protein
MTTIAPIHPGEVLLEEFLEPLGVTQHRLAVSIGVSRQSARLNLPDCRATEEHLSGDQLFFSSSASITMMPLGPRT